MRTVEVRTRTSERPRDEIAWPGPCAVAPSRLQTMSARAPATPFRGRPAVAAVSVGFGLKGLAFAAMISRTPDIRDALSLSSAGFGLLLVCFSGGAICGLPVAGAVVHRVGSARAALIGGVAAALGLICLAGGLGTGSVALAAAGLVALGIGNGVWDVAVNVDGVDLERRLGGSLLPRLHAVFSLGAVTGAGLGTAGSALSVPLPIQLVAVAAVVVGVLAVAVRHFVDERRAAEPASGVPTTRSGLLAAWCEPRTVLIGLVVLGFAFTEGSANDWLAILYVDALDVDTTVAAVAYATFVAAVTVGRFAGAALLRRFGRTAVLGGSAVVALSGLVASLTTGSVTVAFAGTVLWGLGSALGFPVGISMAGSGDGGAQAAARVSVVSSLGYTAFLGGPPLLGLLSGSVGIATALWAVAMALAVALCSVIATHRLAHRESAALLTGHDTER